MSSAASANHPTCLDLFCGIGGLTLGLERAGFTSVGGIDVWEEARATFQHNHRCSRFMPADVTKTAIGDIERFFGMAARDIDIVAGGPPCQGFSTVGKRDAADPRNALWKRFHDLVAEIRPAYVIIENVEGMVVMQKGRVRDAVLESFAEIGYRMKCQLLRAADYGVPQLRKRTFFLGWLEGLVEPHFPEPLGEKYVTVADALFDLPPLKPSEIKTAYEGLPLSRLIR